MNSGRSGTILAVFLVFAMVVPLVLHSCGSETRVAGGGTGGTGISTGVITDFGSVVVNGVRFRVLPGAPILLDDTPAAESDLGIGMVAKVRGSFSADGLNGEAEAIEAENEVQGAISGFGPETDSFTVLSQKIIANGGTLFVNASGIPDLAPGDRVEIHGFRDSMNRVRATRVERLFGERFFEADELRGRVSDLNESGRTFFLVDQLVDYGDAVIRPEGEIENGSLVEVTGFLSGTTLVASIVDLEDLEDAEFEPGEDDEAEVEGIVTNFTGLENAFLVSGQPVRTTPSTRFEKGLPSDLADDVRVEAEGIIDAAGVLLAEEVEFK